MKQLLKACEQELVMLDVSAPTLDQAIQEMVGLLVDREVLAEADRAEMLAALRERERLSSSAIGHAVAVPHAYRDCIEQPTIAIARLKHAINAGAPDGVPTRFVFLLVGPTDATAEHLDSLASLARLMSDTEFRYLAQEARSIEDLQTAIAARVPHEQRGPPTAVRDAGLQYSGRLGGGLLRDLRRRLPYYASDFGDGLHSKCLASTLFLFFACLAPAIIFGGLMGAKTEGQIGAVEMIVATAVCGVVYALTAGQPIIVLGGTGPMLVFTAILYQYCEDHGIAFLPVYAWVGFWTASFTLAMALTDASCLMRYFTRFTDEIFAALISIIFIYEAVMNLIEIYRKVEESEAIGYDVANLSLLLALGTFYVAMSLSRFRNSHLLLPSVREFLADFGPTLAIASMAAIAYFARDVTPLAPLPAPDEFGTTTGRPWLVPIGDASPQLILVAMAPGLVCSVLVFLDQNITARLVNNPDNHLQKGASYHLDLGIVAILIGVCSVFGLPWLVAATVRSLNHLRSLATIEDRVAASGTSRPHVLHVRENRVTGVGIHLLIGLSLLLLTLLQYIPLAVLYGLFLYMGVVSMRGNQFFERISLWLTDPALYPRTHYVRQVPRLSLHLFTLIQLICLVVLWVVKASDFGILFPMFIAMLVPCRFALGRFFSAQDLAALDAEEGPEEEEESWS